MIATIHVGHRSQKTKVDLCTICAVRVYELNICLCRKVPFLKIFLLVIPTSCTIPALRWRHNELDGVSNHQPHDCLLNRLFRRRSKKISKLRVTGLCAGNSPETGEFPAQMASYAENVSIWWRHHAKKSSSVNTGRGYPTGVETMTAGVMVRIHHISAGQSNNAGHYHRYPQVPNKQENWQKRKNSRALPPNGPYRPIYDILVNPLVSTLSSAYWRHRSHGADMTCHLLRTNHCSLQKACSRANSRFPLHGQMNT